MIKRITVAGSRNYEDYTAAKEFIRSCLDNLPGESFIFVSGCCTGADKLGEQYAKDHGYAVERYPAQWKTYGRSAGPKRNKHMAEISDLVICFWDGKSKGTRSMIEFARKAEKPVKIKYI